MGKAALVINAADVSSSSQDALARVTDGFQELISRTYTQLKLLGGVTYSEQQVAGAANPDSGLFDADALTKLDHARRGGAVVRSSARQALGEQVTVKTIVDTFQAKPYGWDLASIEVIVASLIGASKVTLTVDGNVLKRSEVAAALRNTQKHSHAGRRAAEDLRRAQGRRLPQVLHRLLRRGQRARRTRWSWPATAPTSSRASSTNSRPPSRGSKYPFVEQLNGPIGLLEQAVGKPDDWYLTDFNLGDDLLDAKENVIDPIQSFLNGAQRAIYDEAVGTARPHTAATSATCPPAATRPSRPRSPTRTPSGATRWRSSSRPPTTCAARSTSVVAANRATVTAAIEGRKAELARQRLSTRRPRPRRSRASSSAIDQTLARVAAESQVALILQIGANFESSDYPALLDQLAASPAGRRRRCAAAEADRLRQDDRRARRVRRTRNRGGRRQVPRRPAQLRSSRP